MRRNGREKMRLRSTIVEHPFGTMKRAILLMGVVALRRVLA